MTREGAPWVMIIGFGPDGEGREREREGEKEGEKEREKDGW